MGILHIVNGVVIIFGNGQIHIKQILGVGLSTQEKEANRVLAGPINQVSQGDVTTGTLGDFDLFTSAHDPHHGVQNIGGEFLGDPQALQITHRLKPRFHTRNGAMVIRALDVDHVVKATLPLAQMVGHIGHKIRVAAFAFSHHAVFVVSKCSACEPQRPIFLISVT